MFRSTCSTSLDVAGSNGADFAVLLGNQQVGAQLVDQFRIEEIQRFARTDAALNTAYAKVLKSNSDDAKGIALLRAAEHAWIDFRDKDCAFETHSDEGGSIYRTVLAACQIRVTKARIKELQSPDE